MENGSVLGKKLKEKKGFATVIVMFFHVMRIILYDS